MRPIHRTTTGFCLLCLALLAACPSLPLRNPPRVDVIGVQVDRIEGSDAYFTVLVTVTNDRDDDTVIDALQGRLALEGESIAQATLAASPLRVPGHGSARAELLAHAGMDAVLRAAANAMRRGATAPAPGTRPTLRYAIEGSATLAGGVRLPFARSGEIGESAR